MSMIRKFGVRFAMLGLLAAAVMAAPSAFARSHWSVGVNIGGPGFGVGYSDCRHCGRGWGGNYGYGYVGGYYPSYYSAPAYYSGYYPAYYPSYYPSYSSVYYYDRPVRRGYYRGGGHYRDGYRNNGGRYGRDYGHRANYYDRGYRD